MLGGLSGEEFLIAVVYSQVCINNNEGDTN